MPMSRRLLLTTLMALSLSAVMAGQFQQIPFIRPSGSDATPEPINPQITFTIPVPDSVYRTSVLAHVLGGGAAAGSLPLDHVSIRCSGDTTVAETTVSGTVSWAVAVQFNLGTTDCIAKVYDTGTGVAEVSKRFIIATDADVTAPTVVAPADFSVNASSTVVPVTCTDDVACTQVTWSRTGANGVCGAAGASAAPQPYNCDISLVATNNRSTVNAVTITGTDEADNDGTDTINITRTVTHTITTTNLPQGVVDVAYPNQQLLETGGTGVSVSWDNNGAGTTLNDGDADCAGSAISSSGLVTFPTSASPITCSFTARVTDSGANSDTQDLSIVIGATLTGSHDYFDYLVGLDDYLLNSKSLRNQAEIETMIIDDDATFFSYVYPGGGSYGGGGTGNCRNGVCNDDYSTPKDAAKVYFEPKACVPTYIYRSLGASSAGTPSTVQLAGVTDWTTGNGDTYPILITGHSNAALNAVTSGTLHYTPSTSTPGNVTVTTPEGYTGGTGGTIRVAECDCESPGQTICGGGDNAPGSQYPHFAFGPNGVGGSTRVGGNIVSSSVYDSDTTLITTTQSFDGLLSTGDRVAIVNHTSVAPDIYGPSTVTVLSPTTFTIERTLTDPGVGGAVWKWSSTDSILVTFDAWFGLEYYTHQSPNKKLWYLQMGTGGGGSWWTHFYTFPDSWLTGGHLSPPDAAPYAAGASGDSNGLHPNPDLYPPGMRGFKDDWWPTGLGSAASNINDGPSAIRYQEWTRFWFEVRLNRPDTEFDQWKAQNSTGPSGAASALAGRWTMVSAWIAAEGREPTRYLFQQPRRPTDPDLILNDIAFKFNTSAPANSHLGPVTAYMRNAVVLLNYPLTHGACSLGESVATCSARDVAANPTIFVKPIP
jgi:hypothetical protein